MKSSYGIPDKTSINRPAVLIPALQYSYLLPGSNWSGESA